LVNTLGEARRCPLMMNSQIRLHDFCWYKLRNERNANLRVYHTTGNSQMGIDILQIDCQILICLSSNLLTTFNLENIDDWQWIFPM